MHLHVYIYIYIYVCVHIYIYIYIHINIRLSGMILLYCTKSGLVREGQDLMLILVPVSPLAPT